MQKCRSGRALLAWLVLVAACGPREVQGPIRLEKIGKVSGPVGEDGFEGLAMLSPRFTDGERVAFIPWQAGTPPVFRVRPDGTVRDTLATRGQGPGEVEHPIWVIRGLGDTILVVDVGRIHFFGPDRRYVRSIPSTVGGVLSAFQHPNGEIVLSNGSVGGRQSVIDAISPVDGSERWSIASRSDGGQGPSDNRFVALAPDGTIWAVRMWGTYELQQYSPEGKLLRTVMPTVDWFPPYERHTDYARPSRPNTAVSGFWVDSLDRAWVVAQAADPKWASAEGEVKQGEGGYEYFEPKSETAVRDGIIDVVDLTTGRSIATYRRDARFGVVADPGVLFEWRFTSDGWSQLDLYQVSLRSP